MTLFTNYGLKGWYFANVLRMPRDVENYLWTRTIFNLFQGGFWLLWWIHKFAGFFMATAAVKRFIVSTLQLEWSAVGAYLGIPVQNHYLLGAANSTHKPLAAKYSNVISSLLGNYILPNVQFLLECFQFIPVTLSKCFHASNPHPQDEIAIFVRN